MAGAQQRYVTHAHAAHSMCCFTTVAGKQLASCVLRFLSTCWWCSCRLLLVPWPGLLVLPSPANTPSSNSRTPRRALARTGNRHTGPALGRQSACADTQLDRQSSSARRAAHACTLRQPSQHTGQHPAQPLPAQRQRQGPHSQPCTVRKLAQPPGWAACSGVAAAEQRSKPGQQHCSAGIWAAGGVEAAAAAYCAVAHTSLAGEFVEMFLGGVTRGYTISFDSHALGSVPGRGAPGLIGRPWAAGCSTRTGSCSSSAAAMQRPTTHAAARLGSRQISFCGSQR